MRMISADNFTAFKNLKLGDVFDIDMDNILYMKIGRKCTGDTIKYNAVELDDGDIFAVDGDNEVRLRDDVCVTTISNIKSFGDGQNGMSQCK